MIIRDPRSAHRLPALVLFDIAGTTVEDDGFVLRAFLAAANAESIAVDPEWIRARMGLDKREVFRELLELRRLPCDPDRIAALLARFESSIDESCAHARPRDGAAELVAALVAAEVRVGFTTGFPRRIAMRVLAAASLDRAAGLGESMELLVASDEVAHGRPAPDMILEAMRRSGVSDPAQVAVAGDTPSDIAAGLAAGVATVAAFAGGSHERAELEGLGAHLLVDGPRGLAAAWGRA
ncbi:MAG: HAD family hydrolase [Phycisphaerales bacterium]